jgi:tetratricopeptide (TPR) repeat protein
MIKREGRGRQGPIEQHEREAPIAPLGSQINYSEMVLTQVRSAPTNMGWKSVFVTLILAIACAGATSLFYMVRVPSSDKFAAVLVNSHMQEGGRLYEAGLYDQAIVEYNKAIVGRNNYDLAYYRRGQAYEAKGDKERAAADYRKVLEVTPDEAMKQAVTARLRELGAASP